MSTKRLATKYAKARAKAEKVESTRDWNRPDSERYRARAGKLARTLWESRQALREKGVDPDAPTTPKRRTRTEVVSFD